MRLYVQPKISDRVQNALWNVQCFSYAIHFLALVKLEHFTIKVKFLRDIREYDYPFTEATVISY